MRFINKCWLWDYISKEVEFAKELGMDVIITDHHECQDEVPDAIAVINPKQEDCTYPYDFYVDVE